MKSAVVGLGSIGKVHIAVLKELGMEIAAVCDISERALNKYSAFKGYSDYETMLNEIQPDVVHICTPHYLHTEMILAALKRDINVLCEKPLCIKEEDIPVILAAEKASKAQLGVCFQNRYNAENKYVKEYLKDKKILNATGNVIWHRDREYYASSPWRGKWETEGGGVLINQAVHTLDLLQWFLGLPQTVCASVSNLTLKDQIEVEDTAALVCRGKENSFVFFATNGAAAPLPVEVVIQTEDGFIRTRPGSVTVNDELIVLKDKAKEYGKKCYGRGHTWLIKDFYDCIKQSKKFAIDGMEAAKVVKIVLAAYKSNGETVEIKE